MALFDFLKNKQVLGHNIVQNDDSKPAVSANTDFIFVDEQQESSRIPTKHFTSCFLWKNEYDHKRPWNDIGIDRRSGDIWKVALAPLENDFYYGNVLSYEELRTIISEIIKSTNQTEFAKKDAEKYRNLTRENWEEYAFYQPQNRYTIFETSYGAYGSGHYGNVRVTVELVVKEDGYEFSGTTERVPFGFFADKSVVEIENHLSLLLRQIWGVGIPERKDIIQVAYRLKDSDIYLIRKQKFQMV